MTIQDILSGISAIFTSIFSTTAGSEGYATQLVTWLAATPLACLGIYLYVMIAIAGTIRRFLPGV